MRAALSLIIAVLVCTGAARADAESEAATALQHAYLAAQAPSVAEVHTQLHQVINCLVGPKDSLFDAGQPNPCAKLGKGALADTADGAKRNHIKDAVDLAGMGIASTDFERSIMLATGAAGALRESQSARADTASRR